MAAPGAPQTIDLDTLGAADLTALKEQFAEELDGLVRSSVALQRAAGELGSSGRAAERLAQQAEGANLLGPSLAVCFPYDSPRPKARGSLVLAGERRARAPPA